MLLEHRRGDDQYDDLLLPTTCIQHASCLEIWDLLLTGDFLKVHYVSRVQPLFWSSLTFFIFTMEFFATAESPDRRSFGGDEEQHHQRQKSLQNMDAQLSYWKEYNMCLQRKILRLIDASGGGKKKQLKKSRCCCCGHHHRYCLCMWYTYTGSIWASIVAFECSSAAPFAHLTFIILPAESGKKNTVLPVGFEPTTYGS